jgi:site-specific recombinase XerD
MAGPVCRLDMSDGVANFIAQVDTGKQVDDGRHGTNRGDHRNQLGVDTDAEAIAIFCERFRDRSAKTYRNYKMEIQRLVLWTNYVQGKCLSSLTMTDFQAYAKFLQNPPAQWCGNIIFTRSSPSWKPFNGPLSKTSQRLAFSTIGSLLRFLIDSGYLHSNPMDRLNLVQEPNQEFASRRVRERQLDTRQQKALFDWLNTQTSFDGIRVRFIVYLMLYLGLRINEVATHCMGNFVCVAGDWSFQVTGKGKKYAEIGVPERLLIELKRYRQWLGLSELPNQHETLALIMSRNKKPIAARRISTLLKDALIAASELLDTAEEKQIMRACSAHWLRHMYVSKMENSGMELADVQKSARHSNIETTFLYIDSERRRRFQALKKLSFEQAD